MKRIKNITGVVLAGGGLPSAGADPAMRMFDGKPFIEHAVELLYSVFDDVVIVAGHRAQYGFLNLPVYTNIIKSEGPVGDVHSALVNAPSEDAFVIPCDLPFLRASVIHYIVRNAGPHDVAILNSGGIVQPLCGLYRSTCIMPMMQHTMRGRDSLRSVLNHVSTKIITPDTAHEPMVHHAFISSGESIGRFADAAFAM